MSSPFNIPQEIEEAIIDMLAEDDKDHSTLRSCALVCHAFLPICRKHIFNSIAINASRQGPSIYSIQRLLLESPGIADYIRKLKFCIINLGQENASIFESLKRISRLESLEISLSHSFYFNWSDNPLRSTLLHLLHLPTITHFKVAAMKNFVVSDLIPCTNLKFLDFDSDVSIAPSTIFPADFPKQSIKLDSFSSWPSKTLLNLFAHRPDGQWVIDFNSISTITVTLRTVQAGLLADKLFAQCKKLIDVDIKFHYLTAAAPRFFHMLRPSMNTLKKLTLFYIADSERAEPLFGLASELEEMSSENIIENIWIDIAVQTNYKCNCGDEWGRLDQVLSGWSSLKKVSLQLVVTNSSEVPESTQLALRKFPETQFVRLSSSSDIVFNFDVKSYFTLY